jgi:hypothetical protein
MGKQGRRTDSTRVGLNRSEEIVEKALHVGTLGDDRGGDGEAAQGEDGEV